MRLHCLVTIWCACAWTSSGAAEVTAPTSRWVVNFDVAQCVASRDYGTKESPLFFLIKVPPLGSVVQLALIRKAPSGEATQLDASIVLNDQKPLRTSALAFTPKGAKLRTYLINLPLEKFAPARVAQSITIRTSPAFSAELGLSQMGSLLKAMDSCIEDLRKVWNVVDSSGVRSDLRQRASGNLAKFFSNSDYPGAALYKGQSGTVSFALLVDEAGKVADCTVMSTSGVASLDAQTCAVLKVRAKFSPAIGADGKAAKDAIIGRVNWALAGATR